MVSILSRSGQPGLRLANRVSSSQDTVVAENSNTSVDAASQL